MDNHQKTVISLAIDELEKQIKALRDMLNNATETIEITDIEKYISGSGNVTWKCFNNNGYVTTYIRQANMEFWVELGLWDSLNRLDMDAVYGCDIKVEVVREKDFNRIVKVNHFEIYIGNDNDEPFRASVD